MLNLANTKGRITLTTDCHSSAMEQQIKLVAGGEN